MTEPPTTENGRKDTRLQKEAVVFQLDLLQLSSLVSQCLCKTTFNVNVMPGGGKKAVENIYTHKHTPKQQSLLTQAHP